jgi:hydroxyethylthiazole kinase-like uncharacterized protein yjeF
MNKNVLIVGGSKNFSGAVYLAGISALRNGAKSVLIMTPEKVAWTINSLSPDLMTVKLPGEYLSPDHQSLIEDKLQTADILLIGNGASTNPGSIELMQNLLNWQGLKVVDADALRALQDNKVNDSILTPNQAEWELLQKNNDVPTLLNQNNVLIVKEESATTIVSPTDQIKKENINQKLHKAGTGDVLAGLCAGFLAQNYDLKSSAIKAVDLGNEISNTLTNQKGNRHFLASDLADELEVFSKTGL